MAKSSTHIGGGGGGNVKHNSRETYSLSQVFTDEKNEISCNSEKAFSIFRKELEPRVQAYENRTGQKLQKRAITHLSAIVNLEQHHTLKDLEPLKKYLEEKLDTKVFQVVIHRDEGKLTNKKTNLDLVSGEDFFKNPADDKLYFDKKYTEPINLEDYEITKNYHAHIEFLGLDSEGNSIKRNRLNKYFLRDLQTFTAQSLQMERGTFTHSYTKDQVLEITSKIKPKKEYETPKAYGIEFNKVARELGYFIEKTKRLDTHEFKAKAKIENDVKRESYYNFRDMQKQITSLTELTTEQKRELHKLNSKVKNDKATIEELNLEIKKLTATNEVHELEIKELREENSIKDELKAEVKELRTELKQIKDDLGLEDELSKSTKSTTNTDEKELSEEQEIKMLRSEIKMLTSKINSFLKAKKDIEEINNQKKLIEEQKKRINELESSKIDLEVQILEKDKKINSTQDMSALTSKLTTEINEEVKEVLKIEKVDTQKIYDIKSITSFLKKKYFELVSKIKELTTENRELKEENTDLKMKVIKLETDLELEKDTPVDNIAKILKEDYSDKLCEVPDIETLYAEVKSKKLKL